MADASNVETTDDYLGRYALGQPILHALAASSQNLGTLNIHDLAPLAPLHPGGT